MKRAGLAGGLVAVALVVGAVVLWPSAPSNVPVVSTPPQPVDDAAERFVVGQTDRYDLLWTSAGAVSVMASAEPLVANTVVQGELAITTEQVDGDRVVQTLVLTRVDRMVAEMDGRTAELPTAEVIGIEATVTRDARGEVQSLDLPDGVSELAATTLAGIAATALVEFPGDGQRVTPHGLAEDEWSGNTRNTTGYAGLELGDDLVADTSGEGAVTWGQGGRLLTWVSTDSVRATRADQVVLDATDTVRLVWRESGAAPLVRMATTQAAHSTAAPLQARMETLPAAEVLTSVASHGVEPLSSEQVDAVMWSGTARVATDPAFAQQVVAQVVEVDAGQKTRELGLDLLTHAPGGTGERYLLEALADQGLRQDPAFVAYVQRPGFLDAPTQASVDFLHAELTNNNVSIQKAAMASTGAVAAVLARSGTDVSDVLEPLRTRSSSPDLFAGRIRGLGNAGQEDDRAMLIDAASDDSPEVRATAVHALRSYAGEDVTAVLHSALLDPHAGVQRAALSRLPEGRTGPVELGLLNEAVASGAIAGGNVQLTVTALAPFAEEDAARAALAGLLDHPNGDAQSRARIRALLGR